MIRSLLLYYLNIKPTHGYEIQRFLQVSGSDSWAKIQSGSIYYALAKLEKEGFIKVLREERTGARVRKIYDITNTGKEELQRGLLEELQRPIVPSGSEKFLLQSFLNQVPESLMEQNLQKHLEELQKEKDYWEWWKAAKVDSSSLKAEQLAFDMTISSLQYQILWHEELLANIDIYRLAGEKTQNLIRTIDFSDIPDTPKQETVPMDMAEIQRLRNEILTNPSSAAENLDKLITKLHNKTS